MPRAQVTLEAVIAVVLLLLTVLIVFQQSAERARLLEFQKTSGLQKTECAALQSAISTVQSVNENSQVELTITGDFNVEKNTISFSDYYCNFNGAPTSKKVLSKGYVRVQKRDGNVTVENFAWQN